MLGQQKVVLIKFEVSCNQKSAGLFQTHIITILDFGDLNYVINCICNRPAQANKAPEIHLNSHLSKFIILSGNSCVEEVKFSLQKNFYQSYVESHYRYILIQVIFYSSKCNVSNFFSHFDIYCSFCISFFLFLVIYISYIGFFCVSFNIIKSIICNLFMEFHCFFFI